MIGIYNNTKENELCKIINNLPLNKDSITG